MAALNRDPPPIPGSNVYIVRTPVPNEFGKGPTRLICPHCGNLVYTVIVSKTTKFTHLIALLLCFTFPLCVCLPYCTNTCQEKHHYCPDCQSFLGSYRR